MGILAGMGIRTSVLGIGGGGGGDESDNNTTTPVSERRNSRPLIFDQRLNPNALMMEQGNGSRLSVVTMPDNRDYTRTLNVSFSLFVFVDCRGVFFNANGFVTIGSESGSSRITGVEKRSFSIARKPLHSTQPFTVPHNTLLSPQLCIFRKSFFSFSLVSIEISSRTDQHHHRRWLAWRNLTRFLLDRPRRMSSLASLTTTHHNTAHRPSHTSHTSHTTHVLLPDLLESDGRKSYLRASVSFGSETLLFPFFSV